ncbi:MAG TPA: hypothetical protein VF240_09805 [Pyrinomonadaceae bacterium]
MVIGFGLAVSLAGPLGGEVRGTIVGLADYFTDGAGKDKDKPPHTPPGSSAGQTASRATGDSPSGPAFRISRASAAGPNRNVKSADVAYNRDDKEYLVVWQGDGLNGANLRGVDEIFGQRVNAATGREIGPNFLISNMSVCGTDCDANKPRIAYNGAAREYLVVWHGSGLIDMPGKISEVYGQRISRGGDEIGSDFRISNTTDLGKVNGNFVRASAQADVAWNSVNNQYLVIWSGMGQPEDVVKLEIYGQLLTSGGEAVGNDFRISNTTEQGNNFHASTPAVAFNSTNNQYLVVWTGGFKEESRTEVWGRALAAKGGPLGDGDFRISQVSTAAGSNRRAGSPHVVYNGSNNEYFVAFHANGLAGEANEGVNEIFGQRIDAAKLTETGPNDFRVSNMGGAGNGAIRPRVIYNSFDKEYLVIWRGVRANVPPEVFGQRVSLSGTEIDADFQVSNIAAVGKDRSVNAAVVAHGGDGGEYLVVWHGNALPDATGKAINEVFGQRVRIMPARGTRQ